MATVGLLVVSLSRAARLAVTHQSQRPVSRYERSVGKERVLVFVHGIFGDANATWTCRDGAYWPKLILNDEAFKDFDVYVVAYDSPSLGNRMSLDEVVESVRNRLEDDRVFSHREVAFVCHSLGGLVVQRLLLTHRNYASRVPFIYFFSTPQTGASALTHIFSLFSADPLLKVLLPGDNDYLLALETDWQNAHFGVKRFCAYEKQPTKGVLVVDRLSATRNCSGSPVPINEHHMGIVKPCSSRDDSYIALRNAVRNNPIAPRARPSATRPTPPPSPSVKLIFKDSPLFTPIRKQRIQEQLTAFRSYLTSIGFDAPLEVPPLGTVPGTMTISGTGDSKIYYQDINIGEQVIDDPMRVRGAYAGYAFRKMLDVDDLNRWDHPYRGLTSSVLANYFNWSFANKTWSQPLGNSWEGALWEIRERCGQRFTDMALFYMFKTLGDVADPKLLKDRRAGYTVSSEEFNLYFFHGFLSGEQVVDNQFHNLSTIGQILRDHGLTSKQQE